MQIDSQGRTGFIAPGIHSVTDVPGDEGGFVNLAWDASPLDYNWGSITEYTTWRAISTPAALAMLSAGAALVPDFAAAHEPGSRDTDKPVLTRGLLHGETYYWMHISTHTAYHLPGYSEVIATVFDSTAACDDYHYFQVIAHTSDPMVFYVSDPDSGRSVDNLAPLPPLMLGGEQSFDPPRLTL